MKKYRLPTKIAQCKVSIKEIFKSQKVYRYKDIVIFVLPSVAATDACVKKAIAELILEGWLTRFEPGKYQWNEVPIPIEEGGMSVRRIQRKAADCIPMNLPRPLVPWLGI